MTFVDYCRRVEKAGFSNVNLREEGIRCYYRRQEDCIYLVLLWDEALVPGLCPELIDSKNTDIRRFFRDKGFRYCKLLNVICTRNIGFSRRNARAVEPVWFMELMSNRLIVYEGEPADYVGLAAVLEDRSGAEGAGRRGIGRGRGSGGGKNIFFEGESGGKIPAYVNWIFILANIIVYVILEIEGNTEDAVYMLDKGALNVELIKGYKEYYRLFTSMFMHGGFAHLFNNMLVLWYIGDNLERAVGHVKYFIMYLAGGLLSNLAAFACYDYMNMNVCCVGASGAIFSVVGALFYIVAVNRGRLEDLTTRKLGIYIFLSIYLGIQSTTTSNSAHIGGLLGGIVLAVLIYGRRKETEL